MKCFSTAISIPAIIFFALSFFPAQSNGAPALSLSMAEEPVIVQRPFPVDSRTGALNFHKPYQHVIRFKQKEKKAGHTADISHTMGR